MNIYKINTSIYEEEDFFLMTTLTDDEIIQVINPIVMVERDGYEVYDTEMLYKALKKAYPKEKIYIVNEITDIKI